MFCGICMHVDWLTKDKMRNNCLMCDMMDVQLALHAVGPRENAATHACTHLDSWLIFPLGVTIKSRLIASRNLRKSNLGTVLTGLLERSMHEHACTVCVFVQTLMQSSETPDDTSCKRRGSCMQDGRFPAGSFFMSLARCHAMWHLHHKIIASCKHGDNECNWSSARLLVVWKNKCYCADSDGLN